MKTIFKMEHVDKVKKLNSLLEKIEKSKSHIRELERMIEVDYNKDRFGDRNNCFSTVTFEKQAYLETKHTIRLSRDVVSAFCKVFKTAINEEKMFLGEFETEYNNILLEMKL